MINDLETVANMSPGVTDSLSANFKVGNALQIKLLVHAHADVNVVRHYAKCLLGEAKEVD